MTSKTGMINARTKGRCRRYRNCARAHAENDALTGYAEGNDGEGGKKAQRRSENSRSLLDWTAGAGVVGLG